MIKLFNQSIGPRVLGRLSMTLASMSVILLATTSPTMAAANSGLLDPTFGSGGKFVTGEASYGQAVAVDGQGRIVVAGATLSIGSSYNFSVVRLNPNGSFDTSMRGTGITGADFSDGSTESSDWGHAVTIDAQGRIVVAGTGGPSPGCALARFNADGTLDTSFGNNGQVLTDLIRGAAAMSIDGQGRIVVASSALGTPPAGSIDVLAVARFNSDGSLDASFGNGGVAVSDFTDLGSFDCGASGVTIDGSGRIVAAGASASLTAGLVDGLGDQFALARFNSDGTLDTGFGTNGKVVDNYGSLSAVTIDSLGRIVASGNVYDATKGYRDFAVARYNPDGSPDATFGGSGVVATSFSSFDDYGFGVAIDDAGQILVAGAASYAAGAGDFALARFSSTGSLDTTFGTLGKVRTDFGGSGDVGQAMTIDNLGRIVMVGYSNLSWPASLAVARYLSSSADLSTTQSVSPNPVLAGATLTYTIVVTNNGPDPTLAELTDHLPLFVNFMSASASQGNCSQANGIVSCALGNLAPSATATITIRVQPTDTAVGPISNTATVSGNDPNPANNSATANGTVNPAADLSVTVSGSPNPVAGGAALTYTMIVANNGPSAATGVTLTDPLQDTFISASSTQGSCSVVKSKGKSNLICLLGTLNNGATATVTLQVNVPHKRGATSNTASVNANETDPNTANNTATAIITIQ
jgi:uncharacterized delta-60 repeat protein/uncharacterized repeat protein (TIGR01451 family)